jgi:hypothetical protein
VAIWSGVALPIAYVDVVQAGREASDVIGGAVVRFGVTEASLLHCQVVTAVTKLVLGQYAGQTVAGDPLESCCLVAEHPGSEAAVAPTAK